MRTCSSDRVANVNTIVEIYVIGVVVKLEKVRLGVGINGIWCGALLYADDVVLIIETGEELQEMLDKVDGYIC